MRNTEFQNEIKPGDVFITNYDSVRFDGGNKFTFLGFGHCRHTTNLSCKPCKGVIKYKHPDDEFEAEDCLREYHNTTTCDYLVIKVDILAGSNWLDDSDWEL